MIWIPANDCIIQPLLLMSVGDLGAHAGLLQKPKHFLHQKQLDMHRKGKKKEKGGPLQNNTIIEQHLATVTSFLVEKKCEPNQTGPNGRRSLKTRLASKVKFSTRRAEHAGP